MSNYVRQSNFSNGDIVDATILNAEFDQLVVAFNAATGHTHDGTTGGGAKVPLISLEDETTGVRLDANDPNDHKIIFKLDGVDVATLSELAGLSVDLLDIAIEELTNVNVPVANGYFRWDATAQTVEFLSTIDAADTTGFHTIATSGNIVDSNDAHLIATSGNIVDSNDAHLIATSGNLKDATDVGTPVNLGYWKWDATSNAVIYSATIAHSDITGLDSANFTHNAQNMQTFLDGLDSRVLNAEQDASDAAASAAEAVVSASDAETAATRAENAAMSVGVPTYIADAGSFTILDTVEVADIVFEGDGTLVLPTVLVKGRRFTVRVELGAVGKLLTIGNPNFSIVGSKLTLTAGTDLELEAGDLVILEAINTTTLEIL